MVLEIWGFSLGCSSGAVKCKKNEYGFELYLAWKARFHAWKCQGHPERGVFWVAFLAWYGDFVREQLKIENVFFLKFKNVGGIGKREGSSPP